MTPLDWTELRAAMTQVFETLTPVLALVGGLALAERLAPMGSTILRRVVASISPLTRGPGGSAASGGGSVPMARTRRTSGTSTTQKGGD